MIISSHIFETYLQCPSKAWLHFLGEKGDSNIYLDFVEKKKNVYRVVGIERLKNKVQGNEYVIFSSIPKNIKTAIWRLATDIEINKGNLQSRFHAIERLPSNEQDKPAQFIPIRFIVANKLTKYDKLLITFDALVLSEILGQEINNGKIIHGYGYVTLKIKTSPLMGEMRKLNGKIVKMLTEKSFPDLILNRHYGIKGLYA